MIRGILQRVGLLAKDEAPPLAPPPPEPIPERLAGPPPEIVRLRFGDDLVLAENASGIVIVDQDETPPDPVIALEMAAFDRLPHELRQAFTEAYVQWEPIQWEEQFETLRRDNRMSNREAVAYMLSEMRRNDRQTLQFLADGTRKLYGYTLPHVAARASLQDYGPRAPRAGIRRGRRR